VSLILAIGRWVLTLSLSLSRVADEEEEIPPLSSDLAFGFQPDEVYEEDDD
jgi:hypothetical protein